MDSINFYLDIHGSQLRYQMEKDVWQVYILHASGFFTDHAFGRMTSELAVKCTLHKARVQLDSG